MNRREALALMQAHTPSDSLQPHHLISYRGLHAAGPNVDFSFRTSSTILR